MSQRQLTVFLPPEPGALYCIGADVAEGRLRGNYSAVEVFKRPQNPGETLEQVAEYQERVDPDLFAEDLEAIGKYYRYAWLGVENNNVGKAVLAILLHRLKYPMIYWQERPHHEKNIGTDQIGWNTNPATRPFMISQGKSFIRQEIVRLHSDRLIEECLNFQQFDDMTEHALPGKHDDLVIAMLIGFQMHTRCPLIGYEAPVEEEDEPLIWNSSQLTDREFVNQFINRQRAATLEQEQGPPWWMGN